MTLCIFDFATKTLIADQCRTVTRTVDGQDVAVTSKTHKIVNFEGKIFINDLLGHALLGCGAGSMEVIRSLLRAFTVEYAHTVNALEQVNRNSDHAVGLEYTLPYPGKEVGKRTEILIVCEHGILYGKAISDGKGGSRHVGAGSSYYKSSTSGCIAIGTGEKEATTLIDALGASVDSVFALVGSQLRGVSSAYDKATLTPKVNDPDCFEILEVVYDIQSTGKTVSELRQQVIASASDANSRWKEPVSPALTEREWPSISSVEIYKVTRAASVPEPAKTKKRATKTAPTKSR